MKTSVMNFSVDKDNMIIKVDREFAAPLREVWKAWTDSKILDQWWAPKPWNARTRSMDFRNGGQWLYAMQGPEGEMQWSRADYHNIIPEKEFSLDDAFCDSEGKIDTSYPQSKWRVKFIPGGNSTVVNIEIHYNSTSDIDRYLEMGFKEGFAAAMDNLDEYFKGRG